jgi:hypothetical protein
MHEIGGELHDMAPTGARRGQRGLDIAEHLHALRVEIVDADDLAGAVARELPGDEQELRRPHPRDLRILAERLAEAVGAVDLYIRHRGLRCGEATARYSAKPAVRGDNVTCRRFISSMK